MYTLRVQKWLSPSEQTINMAILQKGMPRKGNAGWRRQKCHACMVLFVSDRTPDKFFRHTFLLLG